ncbi:3,4-dihydroxy-2-butanone-4-phosphate synthase [Sphaceloma murrayae]|uniref:3,4-dihydroxy-2-butanone 4-phosphate synthase n=1 Tax=Sphaceloma murrayae TaxID=2082308 RepID=A0A2K1QML0_9PEZI|nr:3,4-dihydroxy-2-butanone-4-phosphate synthase [Sphaceloma murrayae]
MSPAALTNGTTSPSARPSFDSIPAAIRAYASGSFIIVLDSPSRENEGDLIILASALTASKSAFLIHHSSGYLCAPMPASRADALDLPPMLPETANADPNRTAYTITVDAAEGVTTGISAADRALTCRLLGARGTTKEMLRRPGHVVPLRAKRGGVRERQGHTEAAVEFARLAGLDEEEQVGVIAELVEGGAELRTAEREGTGMMRRDECLAFGKKFGIPVVTIEDLVAYVEETEGR